MTRPTEFTIYSTVNGLMWAICHAKGARRGFLCQGGIVYLSGKFDGYRRKNAENLAIEIFRSHGYTEKVWKA